jgi:hypothetical protein
VIFVWLLDQAGSRRDRDDGGQPGATRPPSRIVIDGATGELLREFTNDPTRDYQTSGRPPGPTRK